jgi:hypothetical protein
MHYYPQGIIAADCPLMWISADNLNCLYAHFMCRQKFCFKYSNYNGVAASCGGSAEKEMLYSHVVRTGFIYKRMQSAVTDASFVHISTDILSTVEYRQIRLKERLRKTNLKGHRRKKHFVGLFGYDYIAK